MHVIRLRFHNRLLNRFCSLKVLFFLFITYVKFHFIIKYPMESTSYLDSDFFAGKEDILFLIASHNTDTLSYSHFKEPIIT